MVEKAVSKLMKNKDKRIGADVTWYTLDVLYRMFGETCMGDDMRGDCSAVQSDMCNKDHAKACVMHAKLDFYIHNAMDFGWDVVCQ